MIEQAIFKAVLDDRGDSEAIEHAFRKKMDTMQKIFVYFELKASVLRVDMNNDLGDGNDPDFIESSFRLAHTLIQKISDPNSIIRKCQLQAIDALNQILRFYSKENNQSSLSENKDSLEENSVFGQISSNVMDNASWRKKALNSSLAANGAVSVSRRTS